MECQDCHKIIQECTCNVVEDLKSTPAHYFESSGAAVVFGMLESGIEIPVELRARMVQFINKYVKGVKDSSYRDGKVAGLQEAMNIMHNYYEKEYK